MPGCQNYSLEQQYGGSKRFHTEILQYKRTHLNRNFDAHVIAKMAAGLTYTQELKEAGRMTNEKSENKGEVACTVDDATVTKCGRKWVRNPRRYGE